ncbi:MAG: HDOD domain-containing protein [Pseudoxanthomonas sp.]|uniref:HDOD domain-containing protein n=1 Tax=Pseudoxanthomonas sp. TaxID=1871049 RepID=UPI0028C491C5|nr:HDOD domain-containing protein [Pseudoxanthomonas sp.]MCR6627406.1 HDOD domain-containing protein [Pseudoxanthomonas sp.]
MALLGKVTDWWSRNRRAASVPALALAPATPAGDAAAPQAPSRDWAGPLLRFAGVDAMASLPAEDSDAVIAAVRRRLQRFAEDPQRLPRRPQLLPHLLSTLNDDEASSRDVAGVIARDPTLAATLLKLANSALYRSHGPAVESLDRAVAMVGVDGLRHLVAVALMQPVMRVEGGVFGRLPDLIWDHTQRTALIAADAARAGGREEVFAAQLLALLQGLGAIVVVQALRDAVAAHAGGLPDAGSMAHVLHRWSPRIGRAVAREWGLSERVIQTLDEQGADATRAMSPLARALAMAAPEASAVMDGVAEANAA